MRSIERDGVVCANGNFIKILQVEPINFELKSVFEQEAILEGYKRFLKSCNFDIQLVVQTEVTDISKHLGNIKSCIGDNENIENMILDYMGFVQSIADSNKNVSRRFYIVIKGDNNSKEKVTKIKDGLSVIR